MKSYKLLKNEYFFSTSHMKFLFRIINKQTKMEKENLPQNILFLTVLIFHFKRRRQNWTKTNVVFPTVFSKLLTNILHGKIHLHAQTIMNNKCQISFPNDLFV